MARSSLAGSHHVHAAQGRHAAHPPEYAAQTQHGQQCHFLPDLDYRKVTTVAPEHRSRYSGMTMPNAPSILDSFRLDGKVALVTGSASGIGAALATALAQAGAKVALHGNRRPATETAEAIGPQASAFRADLSSAEGAADLFQQVKDTLGKVDILINNAGMIQRDAAVDTTLESWQQVLQVNLTSVFQLSQLVARDLIARQTGAESPVGGKIVNIA